MTLDAGDRLLATDLRVPSLATIIDCRKAGSRRAIPCSVPVPMREPKVSAM